MSIELLTSEHMYSFKNTLKTANKSIKIISPFIGINTSKIITEFMKHNPNCECSIITRFYTQDFLEGVSSLDALKILKESNVKLYALKNLHSKLYLIDDNYAIIGSANFTMGGFKLNHELSLAIEDEYELLDQLMENSSLERIMLDIIYETATISGIISRADKDKIDNAVSDENIREQMLENSKKK